MNSIVKLDAHFMLPPCMPCHHLLHQLWSWSWNMGYSWAVYMPLQPNLKLMLFPKLNLWSLLWWYLLPYHDIPTTSLPNDKFQTSSPPGYHSQILMFHQNITNMICLFSFQNINLDLNTYQVCSSWYVIFMLCSLYPFLPSLHLDFSSMFHLFSLFLQRNCSLETSPYNSSW